MLSERHTPYSAHPTSPLRIFCTSYHTLWTSGARARQHRGGDLPRPHRGRAQGGKAGQGAKIWNRRWVWDDDERRLSALYVLLHEHQGMLPCYVKVTRSRHDGSSSQIESVKPFNVACSEQRNVSGGRKRFFVLELVDEKKSFARVFHCTHKDGQATYLGVKVTEPPAVGRERGGGGFPCRYMASVFPPRRLLC